MPLIPLREKLPANVAPYHGTPFQFHSTSRISFCRRPNFKYANTGFAVRKPRKENNLRSPISSSRKKIEAPFNSHGKKSSIPRVCRNGCASQSSGGCQLAEDLGKVHVQRRPLHFQTRRFDPFSPRASPPSARLRIDDPNRLHSHRPIILGALLCVRISIVRRQDLDHKQRRISQHIRLSSSSQNNKVRYPDPAFRYSNPLFCAADNSPLLLMRAEPKRQQPLHSSVLPFAHVPLPAFSIHELAVWPIVGSEVFAERDLQDRSHTLKR